MKRKIFAFALVTVFAFVGMGALAADSSPADKLVGTWEGTLSTKDNPSPRLVVESVKRDGDQWGRCWQIPDYGQRPGRESRLKHHGERERCCLGILHPWRKKQSRSTEVSKRQ